jgi:hypothetical protein
MRFLTVAFYFFLAIMVFASIGVFVPYIFEGMKNGTHNSLDFNQNLVTYYIAIFASASLDLILKLIDTNSADKKAKILGLVICCVVVFSTTFYILYQNVNGGQSKITVLLFIGVLIAWAMWWIAHYKDDMFNPSTTLGGDANRTLSNG